MASTLWIFVSKLFFISKFNLLTAFVTNDACTTKNECLQVIKSRHLMSRLDHGIVGWKFRTNRYITNKS